MSLYGAFDKSNHLSELDSPLRTEEGILTAATRRVRTLRNILGDDDITLAEVLTLQGVTAGDVSAGNALVAGDADEATAVLDFSGLTLASGARVLRGSSLDFEAVTGWMAFSGNTEEDAFRYSAYFQPQTAGSAKILGIGSTNILQSGASVNLAEALQAHVLVQSGATVTTRGGDATAGIHPVWAKVGGDVGATWNSGCRVAPIWADMQINGVDVSGEETYGVMITSGGSAFNSLFNFEESAPATYLLTNDTALGSGYLDDQSGAAYEACNTNAQTGNLVVNINGTAYGIPLMAAN